MNLQLRLLLTFVLVLVLGGIFFVFEAKKSEKTGVVFCDVGQGDGFVVLGQGGVQTVIDSGLGSSVVECLGRHVPVWDRSIEMMILTHAQRDHMEGQIEILKRYRVEKVLWTGADGQGALFEEWKRLVAVEGVEFVEVARGDRIELVGVNFEVLWPTKSFIDLWKIVPGGDLNETSLVVRANFGSVCAYFTGDITVERLVEVVDKPCKILKVSHHGSKTGTNNDLLFLARPEIAVIQVGAGNSYGHPTPEVLGFLGKFGINVLRNDLLGDIKLRFDIDGVYLESQ